MKLSPNGLHLVISSGARLAHMQIGETDALVWHELGGQISSVTVDDSGRWAAGMEDGCVRVGETPGEIWRTEQLFEEPVEQVILMNSPLALAAADAGARWRIWKEDRQLLVEHLEQDEHIEAVAFMPEGLVWAGTSDGGELNGDDAWGQLQLYSFTGDEEQMIIASPQYTRRFASELWARGDVCAALWGTDQVTLSGNLPERHHELPQPGVLAGALADEVCITAHADGSLRRWSSQDLSILATVGNAPKGVWLLRVDRTGSRVLIAAKDGLHEAQFSATEASSDIRVHPSAKLAELPKTFRQAGHVFADRGIHVGEGEKSGAWFIKSPEGAVGSFEHLMTEDEEANVDAVSEGSHFAIYPNTLAALSWSGGVLATAAGADDIRVWDASCSTHRQELNLGNSVFPFRLKLDEQGDMLLVASRTFPGDTSQWRLFDTRKGVAMSAEHKVYPGEIFWDATPQLSNVLIASAEHVEVRDAIKGHLIAGPVSLNSRVWFACFLNHGESFLVAARSGHFRVWRTSDASALCAVTEFDTPPADQGAPDDDYRFTVYLEPLADDQAMCRRIAFEVSSTGDPQLELPAGYRVFDMGVGASRKDTLRLVHLCRELSGSWLGNRGQMEYQSSVTDEVFLSEAGKRAAWDDEDAWKLARYPPLKPASRTPTPLTQSTSAP